MRMMNLMKKFLFVSLQQSLIFKSLYPIVVIEGYEDTIARIIREQVEVIFYKMLLKQNGKRRG